MQDRFPASIAVPSPWLAAAALLLFAPLALLSGCSSRPARTAGTANLPPDQLAILHVYPHDALKVWKGQPIHIESIYIGEAQYLVPKNKSFYVLPGEQTFTVDYGPCVHGWAQVEVPFNMDTGVFEGPYGRFDAMLEAGHQYAISASPKLIGKNAVQTEHQFREVAPAANPK